MKPNQKSQNWSAEGSLRSAPAEGHPCLRSPWELAPLPHLKHPTASRGLVLSQLLPGAPPHLLGPGADTSPALGVVFPHYSPQKPVANGPLRHWHLFSHQNSSSSASVLCALHYSTGQPKHPPVLQHSAQTAGFSLLMGSPATGALTSNWQELIYNSISPRLFLFSQQLKALSWENHSLNNAEGAFKNCSKYCLTGCQAACLHWLYKAQPSWCYPAGWHRVLLLTSSTDTCK